MLLSASLQPSCYSHCCFTEQLNEVLKIRQIETKLNHAFLTAYYRNAANSSPDIYRLLLVDRDQVNFTDLLKISV